MILANLLRFLCDLSLDHVLHLIEHAIFKLIILLETQHDVVVSAVDAGVLKLDLLQNDIDGVVDTDQRQLVDKLLVRYACGEVFAAVLREMIQNADDAGAKQMHLVIYFDAQEQALTHTLIEPSTLPYFSNFRLTCSVWATTARISMNRHGHGS